MIPLIRCLSTGLIAIVCATPELLAWGSPNHRAITQTAVQSLGQEDRAIIGNSEKNLTQEYCLIPDTARSNPKSPYVPYVKDFLSTKKFEDIPEARWQTLLHVADRRVNNTKLYDFFTTRILECLRSNDTERGIIYLGTFIHYLEDSTCPGHVRYGVFDYPRAEGEGPHLVTLTFFKRFLTLPKALEKESLHKLVDQLNMDPARLKQAIGDRKPQSLGTTREELIKNLTTRHEESMDQVEKLLLPILQAISTGDAKTSSALGERAGLIGAMLAADYCHTIFEIAKREAGNSAR